MADRILQEDGASRFLEEDGSGLLLLEPSGVEVPFIASATTVYAPAVHPALYEPASRVGAGAVGANTVAVPAGVAPGDLLVAILAADAAFASNSLSGWTQRASATAVSPLRTLQVFTRIASASEPASYTFAGSPVTHSIILAYRGVDGDVPDAVGTGTGSSGPSVTTTQDDDLLVVSHIAANTGTWTPAPGFTEQADSGDWEVADRFDVAAGATGTITPASSPGGAQLNVTVAWKTYHTLPFIRSQTVVYAPVLEGAQQLAVPFIASQTLVFPLVVARPHVDLPFIASRTRVFGVFSLFDPDTVGTGPGNGGESFRVRLAPNATVETATLAADISETGTLLSLTGAGALPTGDPFCLTVDDEVIYVVAIGGGLYRIRGRGRSNTTAAAHTAGATASWTDSYEQAIVSTRQIDADFTTDLNFTGAYLYRGWLVCFDSSQAYLAGARYAMHVTEVAGVFAAGAGSTGANRCDAAQPNAVCTPAGLSDDCPAALSNPVRLQANVVPGDVAVVRYTNPETSPLDLGHRSVALQSWFGLRRVDVADNDVTLSDTAGYVVDTNPSVGRFTGTVNGVWLDPLGPGIAPDTGDPTTVDVPYTSVTLPGADRFFTHGAPDFNETGWPMCALAVRQGRRRVPFWESWDWHDFNYVYSGFDDDATFCQLLINRNGIRYDSVPEVELPGPQDIDGPDAVWDDGSYYFAASWYVVIFGDPYLVAGPSIGGGDVQPGSIDGRPVPTPSVSFPPGGPAITLPPFVEGGSGGGIGPRGGAGGAAERFDAALF